MGQLFTVLFLELFSLITVSWGSYSLYFYLSYSVTALFQGAVVHCTFSWVIQSQDYFISSCSLYFFLSYSVSSLFHGAVFTVLFLELFSLVTVSLGSCSLYFFLSYSVSSLFHGAVVHCIFLELFSLITVSWGSYSLYFFLSYSVTALYFFLSYMYGAVVHCTSSWVIQSHHLFMRQFFFSFSVTALIHEAAFPELFSHSSFKEFSVTGSLPAVNHLTANLSITCLEHFCFNIVKNARNHR